MRLAKLRCLISDKMWYKYELISLVVGYLRFDQWASCQIRKIAGCACAGNVFPASAGQRSRHASRHVRHACAVMHAGIANWRFTLKSLAGKTFPAFPAHGQLYVSGKRPMHTGGECIPSARKSRRSVSRIKQHNIHCVNIVRIHLPEQIFLKMKNMLIWDITMVTVSKQNKLQPEPKYEIVAPW